MTRSLRRGPSGPSAVATGVLAVLAALTFLSGRPSARAAEPPRPARVIPRSEARTTADDVRIRVDAAGAALVEHRLGYRVVAGTVRSFDMTGLERGAAPQGDVVVQSEDGVAFPAHGQMTEPGVLRVVVDDPRGLRRGGYVITVPYRVDLVAEGEVKREGALFRFSWTAPPSRDGFDGARVVWQLPPAPTEPRAVGEVRTGGSAGPGSASGEGSVLATLRRSVDRDELELVRPHVARGEAALWTVRADPKAFPSITDPTLRPPVASPPPPPPPARRGLWAVAIVALVYGAFAWAHGRRGAGVPLVPVPLVLRVPLAVALVAGGLALQLRASPTAGAALVAAAMVVVALRGPAAETRPRGPGQWLPFRPDEAFGPAVGDSSHRSPTDLGTWRGRSMLLAVVVAAAALSAVLALVFDDPRRAHLVLLNSLAFAPFFLTGGASQGPPSIARATPLLRTVFGHLRRLPEARVTPWARVPTGSHDPDEVRLFALPRSPLTGVVGVEVGVAWARSGRGVAAVPEVLVRVRDGSAAEAKLTEVLRQEGRAGRPLPGRREGERVHVVEPPLPTALGAAACARELLSSLSSR